MEDQLTDHPKKDVLRGGPTTGKALLIGLAPAVVVMVGLILGVVLFNKPASPPTVEAQITTLMEQHVESFNTGDAAAYKATFCQRVLDVVGELEDKPPLEENLVQLDEVTDVQVIDDNATATVTVSQGADPEMPSQTVSQQFVNEDGWKLCNID